MGATGSLDVAATNVGQLDAWDGEEGAYWAEHADHFDRSVAAYHRRLLEAAAIEPADRVLDVGCGTGQTTRDAGRAARRGTALGVDLSSRMLAVARHRAAAEQLTNVVFEQADAQIHPFEPASFDVAIGRTSAMFFGDLVAGLRNVAVALRPGGRLALLTWQGPEHNQWLTSFAHALTGGRGLPAAPPNAPGPFALSQPDRVREVLTAAGFSNVDLEARSEPMYFGPDADDASAFILGVSGWMANTLPEAERPAAYAALHADMAAHDRGPGTGVTYRSGTWIITATV